MACCSRATPLLPMLLLILLPLLAGPVQCSSIPPQEFFCPACLPLAADALADLATNATSEDIIGSLDKLCALLPSSLHSQCDADVLALAVSLNSSDESIAVKYPPRAICAVLSICTLDCCAVPYTPEQIHLAITQDPTEMRVNWVTLELTPNPVVQWGLAQSVYTSGAANGSYSTYTEGGWRGYVYTAVMTDLTPNTRYFYRVGDANIANYWDAPNWSLVPELNFVTAPLESAPYPLVVASLGDMGGTDAADRTVAQVGSRVLANTIDLMVHAGDIAYGDGYEALFDQFCRKIEPLAAYVPYMTAPGNHEGFWAFHGYLTRFTMPWEGNSPSAMYYSVLYGRVLFVAFNTEGPDGLIALDLQPGGTQHEWLASVLAAAAVDPAVDWIVAFAHRPLYCSSSEADCVTNGGIFREAIEPLFLQYGVDLVLQAHRHNYERTYPVANGQVTSTSYAGATAPVYIVNGVAGNKEGLSGGFAQPPPVWSAFSAEQYGYGLLTFVNATALEWQYFSASTDTLLDSIVLTQAV